MQWLPEVDDEVLIGFELDDKTRPVVLGGLWNRQDPPPQPDAPAGGKVNDRVLASRKDSRLTLTDDPTPVVALTLGGTPCAVHLEAAESAVTGDQKLVITANVIEIRAKQKLTLGGAQVEITASGALTAAGKPIKLN
jgi:uncharacterized protein involved in type VI secretion and phage assembly